MNNNVSPSGFQREDRKSRTHLVGFVLMVLLSSLMMLLSGFTCSMTSHKKKFYRHDGGHRNLGNAVTDLGLTASGTAIQNEGCPETEQIMSFL